MGSIAEAPRLGRRAVRDRAGSLAGILWIVVLGGLLAGVVAVNVLVLQLNVGLDRLGVERAQLTADIARLESQLSSAAAAARLEREARTRLGLERADAGTTTYVRLPVR